MEGHAAIRELVERSRDGHITALQAARLAVQQECLLVGTAQSQEGYVPRILLSAHFEDEQGDRRWGLVRTNERDRPVPAIRAGKVAETAVWAAFGGDPNHPLQRLSIDRSFVPNPEGYDLGTHGWRFNASTGGYKLRAHENLMTNTRDIDDDTIVGSMDLLMPKSGNLFEFPNEPGHFAVSTQQETVGQLTVRMGDVRQLHDIHTYYYEPLSS